ncbi:oxysterol-binding protein-related protein 2 [Trichechus manatus latirostris]|uniref:Oxysterol-binding protein n=1 Tax=Trichechus manatus latirostris TaxID=127582 RepID=A0A2Y9RU86_TRIMA|nr:oxysterol-binding protein-related protein 2 [Trichechus manatus latirostris]
MNSEEEFFDAVTGFDSDHSGEFSEANQKVTGGLGSDTSKSQGIGKTEARPPQENGVQTHRTSLPAPMFTRSDFSVWSILKKCIGLELSKITMPIAFNEPLSFLQRITEYMEHVYLIHKASRQAHPLERMQSVAAFAVSAVASQWERTGKPFNPLLGETYELIREDLGFRFISEQVSHHPPVSAFYSEGLNQDFIFHGSIYPKLKFWGKSVEAEPRGTITLELLQQNEAYTWTNPTCCVHNVIIGKLWIEQYGTVEILNHRYLPFPFDYSKKKLFMIYGKWTECLWGVDPASYESFKKQERRGEHLKKTKPVRCPLRGDGLGQSRAPEVGEGVLDEWLEMSTVPITVNSEGVRIHLFDVADNVPETQETMQVIPGSRLLWRINMRPPNSAQIWQAGRRSAWKRNRGKPGGGGPERRLRGGQGGFTKATTRTQGLPTGCTQGATLSATSRTAQTSTEGSRAPGPEAGHPSRWTPWRFGHGRNQLF